MIYAGGSIAAIVIQWPFGAIDPENIIVGGSSLILTIGAPELWRAT